MPISRRNLASDPTGIAGPLYERFLDVAARAGCAIELNTAGLRKDCREIYPCRELLELAFAKKVPITFGSDAHAPEEVGMNFADAIQLARGVGYTHWRLIRPDVRAWHGHFKFAIDPCFQMRLLEFARNRSSLVIGLILGLVTLALYAQLLPNSFINYDDTGYITENPSVTRGVSWSGIVWAFSTFEQGNWHPLTWISHMLDCQLYGLNPAGHHLTNALLHTANTLLVFCLLRRMTGKIGPSAFVAALFGWHPVHVESVAWASERKDVLCAFFWLLAMMAYVSYVKKTRPGMYLLALVLFACSLMSKPMAVTLPTCVLLLVDFWPLNQRWSTVCR